MTETSKATESKYKVVEVRVEGGVYTAWTLQDPATGRTATGYDRAEAEAILSSPLGPKDCPMCSQRITGMDIRGGVVATGPLGSWAGTGDEIPWQMFPLTQPTVSPAPSLNKYRAMPCGHELYPNQAEPIIAALDAERAEVYRNKQFTKVASVAQIIADNAGMDPMDLARRIVEDGPR